MIPSQERSGLPVAFIVGLVIVTILVGGAVLLNHFSSPAGPEMVKSLPMGPSEQAYAPQIHFLEPKMSRAANFLNQEVTFIFGKIENGGNRQIRQIEITLEFHDPYNKIIVLRDTQRLFSPKAEPLAPGEQRDFQIGYETISAQWNNIYPTIRITGLDFK